MKTHVDYRASSSLVGTVLKYIALALLFPIAVAIFYRESVLPFVTTILVAIAVGTALERLDSEPDLGHREGFLFIGLVWLAVPLLGTLPYLIAGEGTVAHPVNALFESMSGFTTTGATVLGDISFETHSRSMLMWRQLTQWLGGMGIVVLMVAILPQLSVGGAQLVKNEAPGFGIDKLTPHINQTARALWGVYIAFTALACLLYYGLHLTGMAPQMDFYNAIAHALTTMPTGGFSPEARSIEAFSPAVQWMVMPFMIIAGTNFALLWHALHGRPNRLVENAEFRTYLAAMGVLGALVATLLFVGVGLAEIPVEIPPLSGNVEHSARQALFQILSIVTTTGYASMDFNTWSPVTQSILLFAMFLGGSAGSAAGSIKIIRWYVIGRSAGRELFTTVHPEAIRPIRFGDKSLDENTIRGIYVLALSFFAAFALSTLVIFLDAIRTGIPLSSLEAMSVAMATLGNIGPGFGVVGPMDSYLPFSAAAKVYMVFLMWIGRLEILSVLVLLTPSYWRS
ncbi:potassium transporter [Halalkalicoccus paucihalophilus]|uniref:Potassium transporter n=1 Tax=Halalkalicoccus paucihalophilus TaxID=1008153 RepID=A0A151ABT9_9EURY|nr:TrkH family potassium uptake protein [Halalkalicoccus paucihalophilus]KYH24837.1 potassium transporter [Halalkalicoccus paucihalophilus]